MGKLWNGSTRGDYFLPEYVLPHVSRLIDDIVLGNSVPSLSRDTDNQYRLVTDTRGILEMMSTSLAYFNIINSIVYSCLAFTPHACIDININA